MRSHLGDLLGNAPRRWSCAERSSAPFFLLAAKVSSELKPHRDLTGAGSAEIGSDRVRNQAEARITDVCFRIPEIRMVEDVGKGALGPQTDVFRKGEGLTKTGRKVDGAGTDDGADLRIPETADGIRKWTEWLTRSWIKAGASCAWRPKCPAWITWACECSGIDPVIPGAALRFNTDTVDAIGRLVAVPPVKSGGCSIEARAGTGGVTLTVGEVGRFEGPGLPNEDVRQLPTAHDGIG